MVTCSSSKRKVTSPPSTAGSPLTSGIHQPASPSSVVSASWTALTGAAAHRARGVAVVEVAGLEQRLDRADDLRPAAADLLQHLAAGREAVVDHRELHERAVGFELELTFERGSAAMRARSSGSMPTAAAHSSVNVCHVYASRRGGSNSSTTCSGWLIAASP